VLGVEPATDVALEPGDVITVFSKTDILSPSAKRTCFVRLEGEVGGPGVYQVRPGETLRDAVQRAGGLTKDAYLFAAEFNRESVRREQQERLEEITARAERELDRTATERLSRALTAEDAQSVRAQIDAQRAALHRMKALRATGRMVLGVKIDARSVGDLPDLVLEDGDRFFVPSPASTVAVYGSVYNQSNLIYRPGRTLDEYLQQAGGPTRTADAGSTYVLRADGSVMSKRQAGMFSRFGSRVLLPNDSVVVPEEYAPTSWIRELKDFSQIFYQFGLGLAALKVLGG
jgi:protein involved in polysaccharide export with SLBB domain